MNGQTDRHEESEKQQILSISYKYRCPSFKSVHNGRDDKIYKYSFWCVDFHVLVKHIKNQYVKYHAQVGSQYLKVSF